jgi:beta propeller repeat protein
MSKKLISFVIVGILMISGVVLALQISSKEIYTPQRIPLSDLGIEDDPSFVVLDIYKDKMLIILSFPSRGIYVYNLTSKETMNLTANIKGDIGSGDIYEDIIVWSEKREIKKETGANISRSGISAYNLTSGEEISVCVDPAGMQVCPQIWGDVIVWESGKFADEEGYIIRDLSIYAYNLKTKERFPVCIGGTPPPRIYGDIVVWEDKRNGNQDIYGYNLKTKEEFPICTRDGDQSLVGIWENKMLYAERASNTIVKDVNF